MHLEVFLHAQLVNNLSHKVSVGTFNLKLLLRGVVMDTPDFKSVVGMRLSETTHAQFN